MSDRHPIIANGELYAQPVNKPIGGGPKTLPHEYEEAKARTLAHLSALEAAFSDDKEVFMEEKIICLRLEPKFEAKSYVPSSIISAMPGGKIVGGRKYKLPSDEDEVYAKLYFVKTTANGVSQLKSALENGTNDSVEQWRNQLRSLYSIDLLSEDEKVMGFENDWDAGSVEFVLHPFPGYTDDKIRRFIQISGIDEASIRVKTYDDGITFISANCSQTQIQSVKRFNALRAIHPLGMIDISTVRSITGSSLPQKTASKRRPSVKVGVFDGGADPKIPILQGYVSEIDATGADELPALVHHGSGVCSAILYGSLAGKSSKDTLDSPMVSIDCYRVLPLNDYRDIDLYEAIDTIENIVPNQPDTRLFNLSFGPKGAIVDDSISRFSYALDQLTYNVPEGVPNPLFVVAVGNDGELPADLNRIQAPADMVNGLGIGAYTFDANRDKVPSTYSCVGPGREGGKTKPDLLDFGGDQSYPFIIPSLDHKTLSATAGTSFAAPMVTGKIGKMMAMSKSVTPHLGRALLIHHAENNQSFPTNVQGFGFCKEHISDVLECGDNYVTVMYQGEILPTQYLSLPVFAPHINEMPGMVEIDWTVALVVSPNANDPDAYTNNCIEDVFAPNSMKYSFTKKREKAYIINLLDQSKVALAKDLINNGYKRSAMPVSHQAKIAWDETDLRVVELKWDTVIRKHVRMRSSSLFDPTLTLHAMGRNGFESKPMAYNVVITINAPKYKGSLYDAVLQTYRNLSPIELRAESRIVV